MSRNLQILTAAMLMAGPAVMADPGPAVPTIGEPLKGRAQRRVGRARNGSGAPKPLANLPFHQRAAEGKKKRAAQKARARGRR